MADTTIGARIELGGEKELREALKEIKNGYSLLSSEMKLATSEFENNGKSVNDLAKTNEVLTKQVEAQQNAVDKLAEGAAKAAESFGENSAEAQKWQTALNNAKAELNNTTQSLEDNEKAQKESGKTTEEAKEKWEKFGSAVGNVAKAVGAAAVALGGAAVAAGKQIFDMAENLATEGDRIDKSSQKLGISAEAYQEWAHVFDASGADIGKLETGMKKLGGVIQDAAGGSDKAAEKLKAVGLSIEDLNGLSQEEQLNKVVEALQGMESGAERTTAATDLLGSAAVDMAAVLNTSAEDTQALKDEAHDLGMVLSDEAVAASANFGDSLSRLTSSVDGVKNSLIADLLPGITDVMDALTGLVTGSEGAEEQLKAAVDGLVADFSALIPKAVEIVTQLASSVAEVAPQIIEALMRGILDNLPALLDSATKIILELVSAIISMLPEIIKAGIELIITLAQGISEALPELIPAVVDAVTTVILELANHLPELLAAGIQLTVAVAEGLVKAIPQLVSKLPQIISSIVDGLSKGLPDILDVGKNIVKGIWDGISAMGTWIKDKVTDFFGGIVDGVKGFLGIHSPSKVFAGIGENMGAGIGVGFTSEMKDVERDMQKAIPTDFDIDADVHSALGNTSGGRAFNVTIPLALNGNTLAKVLAEIQWTQNAAYVRNTGVLA